MEPGFLLLKGQNREEFESVFPKEIREGENRISIGAYREDGAVLGAFSAFLDGDEICIDWLYVDPTVRRQGVATALMDFFRRFIAETLEVCPIVARFPLREGDLSLHRFFLSLPDSEVSFSHDRIIISPPRLRAVARRVPPGSETVEVRDFFDQSEEARKTALEAGREELELRVEDWDLFLESCVPELCKCIYQEKVLTNLILIRKEEGDLEIAWLYSTDQEGLYTLFKSCAKVVQERFPEASLIFEAMNESVAQLGAFLFPRAEKVPVYEAELSYS